MLSLAGAPPRGNKIPPQRTFRDFRPLYPSKFGKPALKIPAGVAQRDLCRRIFRPAVPTAPAHEVQGDFPSLSGHGRIFLACGANRTSSLFFPALPRPAGGGGEQGGEGPVGLGLVPVGHRGHVVPALEHPPVGHPDLLQSHPQVLGEADGI